MSKGVALLLVLVLLIAFCITVTKPTGASAEAAENTWITRAPMHEARGALGVAVVNGKIYAIGGSVDNNGGFVGANEEYDPATDTWTFKTPMPTPRAGFGIAVYENKIYCIGGEIKVGEEDGYAKFGQTGVNEVYDPATDTWETKMPMPTPRFFPTSNVVNGKIYLIRDVVNEVYDPETDSWTTKTPHPTAALDSASAVVDNRIYIIGGIEGSGLSNRNQIYDPENDSWSSGASAPRNAVYAAAGATTGVIAPKRIYVFGVNHLLGIFVPSFANQVYDPENDSWMVGASIPTNRINLGIAVVNDTLYAIGGHYYGEQDFLAPSAVNEQYIPIGYGTIPNDNNTPEDNNVQESFPTALIIAITLSIVVVSLALFFYFRKKKSTENEQTI